MHAHLMNHGTVQKYKNFSAFFNKNFNKQKKNKINGFKEKPYRVCQFGELSSKTQQ